MAMIVLAALAMAEGATTGGEGWQVRSLVRGTRTPVLRLACIPPDPEGWVQAILPPALWRDCDLGSATGPSVDAPCRGGGRLRVAGTRTPDRFDLIVRRTGPVGANRAAAVTLHVEGNRTGGCTPLPRNP